ncbi:hypothetical protein ACGFNU_11310 [Spirillospora sp. NPDC048911]|uniref:hypothetical protein n=1 Tax=Spirillospora sp. NPDC048911 TaxID=3364527 RepID=UPI0037200A61
MTDRHLPKVVRRARRVAAAGAGGIACASVREYVLTCTCAGVWEAHPSKRLADADRIEHLNQVCQVPLEQQCRRPRAHKRAAGEYCELCVTQIALDLGIPGLDDGAVSL